MVFISLINLIVFVTFFLILLIFLAILFFANSLFFSLSLLSFVLLVLFFLVSSFFISSLTALMLSIVYIGAIIILIGYICAICPNISVEPNNFSVSAILTFCVILSLLLSPQFYLFSVNKTTTLLEYFYTSNGFLVFSIMVVMLFFTLLIVTSQYLTPNGPFRSLVS